MDVAHGEHVVYRATIMQQKTGQPVRFKLTAQTLASVRAWIANALPKPKSLPYLQRRGARVRVCIDFVFELTAQIPAVLFDQFLALANYQYPSIKLPLYPLVTVSANKPFLEGQQRLMSQTKHLKCYQSRVFPNRHASDLSES